MTKKTKSELANIRFKAWETRRKKYGSSGHSGGYTRLRYDPRVKKMVDAIIEMHMDGMLSEGQTARILSESRLHVRMMVDEYNDPSR